MSAQLNPFLRSMYLMIPMKQLLMDISISFEWTSYTITLTGEYTIDVISTAPAKNPHLTRLKKYETASRQTISDV